VGDYPGVILIHEWWGLNDGIKESARTLASEGYNVFAVDLFGKVAPTPDAARAQVGALDQAAALQNMTAAHTFLTEHGVKKIAVWGWCFGGGQAMQFSLSGKPLAATVIYYGNLVTDESRLQSIHWPVLGIFGQEDTSVKPESAVAFDQTLTSLGIEHEVKIYPNVGHAFANPSGPNYAPDETKDAWEKTLTFLDESLR
jgi:carboxymethylenebutenolidase